MCTAAAVPAVTWLLVWQQFVTAALCIPVGVWAPARLPVPAQLAAKVPRLAAAAVVELLTVHSRPAVPMLLLLSGSVSAAGLLTWLLVGPAAAA
jgi:hypothetical protein